MTDRLIELLELNSTFLLDLDREHRMLVRNDETGSHQLYEISPDGSRRQLTDFGQPVTGRYLPGQRLVIASVDDSGTERSQLWTLDPDSTAAPEPFVSDPAFIHTLQAVAEDRVIYTTNRRNGVDFDVISRQVSTGAEIVLFDGGGWFTEVAVSPDGAWIALTRMTLLPASSQVLLAPFDGEGLVTAITDPLVAGDWYNLHWLPDSSALLASSDAAAEFGSLRRFDLAEGRWDLMHEAADADVLGWPSPDGNWWAVATRRDGADELSLVPVGGGRPVVLTLPDIGVVTYLSDVVFAPDSLSLGLTFASPVDPPEAYAWTETAGLQRRSESNPLGVGLDLARSSSHRVRAADGELIPVLTLTPPEADGSAVMVLHGGPESASVQCWNPVSAALAIAGHTVVLPNIRGSAGYGRRWLSLDDVDKRRASLDDLVAVRDWLPSIGVQQDRVALYGGSYGGYLVLAGLTFYPDLWAAGVDIVGMSSLVTFLENTSPYRRAYREREYGSLGEHRQILLDTSPLPRISELRAPLLIIHGANDPRVPLSEAEQVAAAVRANGIDCELLVYADEGHGLAKRVNRLDAYPQVLRFLARQLAQ